MCFQATLCFLTYPFPMANQDCFYAFILTRWLSCLLGNMSIIIFMCLRIRLSLLSIQLHNNQAARHE